MWVWLRLDELERLLVVAVNLVVETFHLEISLHKAPYSLVLHGNHHLGKAIVYDAEVLAIFGHFKVSVVFHPCELEGEQHLVVEIDKAPFVALGISTDAIVASIVVSHASSVNEGYAHSAIITTSTQTDSTALVLDGKG